MNTRVFSGSDTPLPLVYYRREKLALAMTAATKISRKGPHRQNPQEPQGWYKI